MIDFETEVDYGRLSCSPLSREYFYLIPKERYDAEKAELVALRAGNAVLREHLENAISAMVDLGSGPDLCELVEARSALAWVKAIEQLDTKIEGAMVGIKVREGE